MASSSDRSVPPSYRSAASAACASARVAPRASRCVVVEKAHSEKVGAAPVFRASSDATASSSAAVRPAIGAADPEQSTINATEAAAGAIVPSATAAAAAGGAVGAAAASAPSSVSRLTTAEKWVRPPDDAAQTAATLVLGSTARIVTPFSSVVAPVELTSAPPLPLAAGHEPPRLSVIEVAAVAMGSVVRLTGIALSKLSGRWS
mmetsp:Transcript_31748/g.86858  ORF Transcript_31748/g.86858 Transcript_31748/m.86858 type:complete len:204 (+) Transcript_31748:3338-3949(+)